MKKAKIIIPALGLLVLSTTASITGTVAWFTASRTATIEAGEFAVIKTDGQLDLTLTQGVGTTVANTAVSAKTGAGIGDVSFNPATKQLYTDTGDGTQFRTIGDTSSYSNLTDANHPYKLNDTAYYAFTWQITLRYTWGADHTALNVFFDYANEGTTGNSMMTPSAQTGGTLKNETSKGFRIAMIATRTVVYAGLQEAANLQGVTGTNTTAAYGATGLTSDSFSYFASDKFALGNVAAASATAKSSYVKAVDGDASQTSRADYLGQITYSGTSDTITIYCVAWYEGTDPQIVNEKEMEQVKSTLKFYATTNA